MTAGSLAEIRTQHGAARVVDALPSWSMTSFHGGASLVAGGRWLGLIWASQAIRILRDAHCVDLAAGDVMMVDLGQPFQLEGQRAGWSAELLDFGSRDIARRLNWPSARIWHRIDPREEIVSAVRNLWGVIRDFHRCHLAASEYRAMEMLVDTLAALGAPAPERTYDRYPHALLTRAKAIVQSRIACPTLGVTTIAEGLGLSTRRIAMLFAAEDLTPTGFITAQRMALACDLLLDPAHPTRGIDAVAQACGYASHSYFCKAFRGFHGVTPSAFRAARPAQAGGAP